MKLLKYHFVALVLALMPGAMKAMGKIKIESQSLEINLINEYGQVYKKSYPVDTRLDVGQLYPQAEGPYAFENCLNRFSELVYHNTETGKMISRRCANVLLFGLMAKLYEALRYSFLLTSEFDYVNSDIYLRLLEAEKDKVNYQLNGERCMTLASLYKMVSLLKDKDAVGNKSIALTLCSVYTFKRLKETTLFKGYLESDSAKHTLLSPLMQFIYSRIVNTEMIDPLVEIQVLLNKTGALLLSNKDVSLSSSGLQRAFCSSFDQGLQIPPTTQSTQPVNKPIPAPGVQSQPPYKQSVQPINKPAVQVQQQNFTPQNFNRLPASVPFPVNFFPPHPSYPSLPPLFGQYPSSMTPISSSVSQGAPQIAQKPPQVNPFSYNCDQCGYTARDKRSLSAHKRIHYTTFNSRPTTYKSNGCGKSFATFEELRAHNLFAHNQPQQNTSSQSQIAQGPQPSLANSQVRRPLIPPYLMNNLAFMKRVMQLRDQFGGAFAASSNPECIKKVRELVEEFESAQKDASKAPQSASIVPTNSSSNPPQVLSTAVSALVPAAISLSSSQAQPTMVEKQEQAPAVSSQVQHVSDGKQEQAPVVNSQAQQAVSVGSSVQAASPLPNAKRAAEEEQEVGFTCNTCFELFKDPKEMATLSCKCNGYYHLNCLKSWWSIAGVKDKCPICGKTKLKTATFETVKNIPKKKRKKTR
jgi:hypothetical protein